MFRSLFTAVAATAILLGSAASAQAGEKLAEQHIKAGLQCQTCHGQDMKNPEMPTIETCTGCHNTKQLVAKTKNVKPTNPHVSPHYGDTLECTNCHLMHQESENYCNQCHEFNFKEK